MATNTAKPQNDDPRSIIIPPGFQLEGVDSAIAAQIPNNIQPPPAFLLPPDPSAPSNEPVPVPITTDRQPEPGSLGIALSKFTGKFKGRGLNQIFRPRNSPDSPPEDDPRTDGRKDNLLEYDLTEERLQFLGSSILKDVPNRGFGQQRHVNLRGTPYIQTVDNVLNPVTVQPDAQIRTGIHFEPGLFMRTPALTLPDGTVKLPATISRMASIPHGTTINAQGLDPTEPIQLAEGKKPDIPVRDQVTIPFFIDRADDPAARVPFPNNTYDVKNKFRIPEEFPTGSFITEDIFKEPNNLLLENNLKKNIKEVITFTVTTTPTKALPGGGTDSIAFLSEPEIDRNFPTDPDDNQPGTKTFNPANGQVSKANANASSVTATFWISTIVNEIEIPPWTDKLPLPMCAPLDVHPDVQGPRVFKVRPNRAVTKPTKVKVESTQIQYSQLVLLDFGPLSWPHISVATLVPDDDLDQDILIVDVTVPDEEAA
jgi:hypothetical protein